jgi:hypothetical protein
MKQYSRLFLTSFAVILSVLHVTGQNIQNNPQSNHGNKFEQLGIILSDPNVYRTASGAPGSKYWQQRADYDIDVTLDEKNLRIDGTESITYYNNSPDALSYLWLQLDENQHDPKGENNNFDGKKFQTKTTEDGVTDLFYKERLEKYGCKIVSITDELGKSVKYTINQTMLRIDLPKPLKPGAINKFKVKWYYFIPDRMSIGGRGGYEFFPEDGNHLFTISQWYPRMCVYSDYQGWNNKQFTGGAEFALTFGKFKVKMTVPSDHVVASTGQCQNYLQTLSPEQSKRWQKAQTSKEPVEIVTLGEATAAEKTKATGTKTWIFTADSVRDFAWTSSRKYCWDAMPITIEGKKIMCMSLYPKESHGLYRKYSTKTIAHTLRTYSKFTIPYPYPVAQSIEAASGMEYPMICFNFGRTEKDGTYSEATKNGMLGVIIHEVGHNFFPMIINSDERQWAWMDEGLNTFVQFLTEQEFDNNFPARRGPASKIVDYMKMPKDQLEPIMTNSDNIIQYGNNAYGKAATALNVLRETVMGRELFDHAFKTYAQRWAFKHPAPSDFFRTMEDASGVDLDWFWRGWFLGIDPVDISLDTVKVYAMNLNPDTAAEKKAQPTASAGKDAEEKKKVKAPDYNISRDRNKAEGMKFLVDADTSLRDFYYYNKQEEVTRQEPRREMEKLPDSLMNKYKANYYYELTFSNKGGLVMPIILQWNYKDGTTELERINAYIWRKNENKVVKSFAKGKEVASIQLDPFRETADIDENNNAWNVKGEPSKFDLFKSRRGPRGGSTGVLNPMQIHNNKKKE